MRRDELQDLDLSAQYPRFRKRYHAPRCELQHPFFGTRGADDLGPVHAAVRAGAARRLAVVVEPPVHGLLMRQTIIPLHHGAALRDAARASGPNLNETAAVRGPPCDDARAMQSCGGTVVT